MPMLILATRFFFLDYRSRSVWSASPEVAAKFNSFKAWVSMTDATHEKFNKAPAAVDFTDAKKKVRDQELVANLEAFYKSASIPVESHVMPPQEKTKSEENIALLKQVDALNKEFIPVLEKEIAFLKNNRTNSETTLFDMQVNYPLIHEEIENELENREWFKDTEYIASKDDHH